MTGEVATEMILIRHAPAILGGRLCGRTDVPADVSDSWRVAAVREALGSLDRVVCSPAKRCVDTARALWPDMAEPDTDADRWEQDFGAWVGVAFSDLPVVLGSVPRALSFEVAPLSVTRLRRLGAEGWSVAAVNWGPA